MEPPKKPSTEAITDYCKQIEKILSAQGWEIRVNVREKPLGPITSSLNKIVINREYIWIKSITLIKLEGKEIELLIPRNTIPEKMNKVEVWNDAFQIQDQIYRMEADELDEKYWKLWDHCSTN
jgi:hypothetical protein